MTNSKKFSFAAMMLLVLSGCTQLQVWERENIARAEMQWGPDPLESAMQDHIYFSKEASSGGAAAAGGGCGCN